MRRLATHDDVAPRTSRTGSARGLPELRAPGGWLSNGVSHRNLRSAFSVMRDALSAVSGAAG
jgi:hypothetical protein